MLNNFTCVYDTTLGGFMPTLLEQASTLNKYVFLEAFIVNYVVSLNFLQVNWEELEKQNLSL